MRDDLRRAALFTSGVAEMTRNRAEDLIKGLMKTSEGRRDQTQGLVKDLVEWSTQNRKEIMALIGKEVESQLGGLGLASRREVERLERRVARLEDELRSQAVADAASKKTSRRKTSAKTTRGRSTTGASAARASTPRRAAARGQGPAGS